MHLFHTAVEKPVDNLAPGDLERGKRAITKRVLTVEKRPAPALNNGAVATLFA